MKKFCIFSLDSKGKSSIYYYFRIEDPFLASVAIVTSMKGFEIPLYIKEKKGQYLEPRVDKLLKMLFNGILKK